MKITGTRLGTKEETKLVHGLSFCVEDALANCTDSVEEGINVLIYTIARLEVKYSTDPEVLEANLKAVIDGLKANVAILQKEASGKKTS